MRVRIECAESPLAFSRAHCCKRYAVSARAKRSGDSRFPLDEFSEARIVPKRIEHRIESEERRREWHACGQTAIARPGKYPLQNGNRAIGFAHTRGDSGKDFQRLHPIRSLFFDRIECHRPLD